MTVIVDLDVTAGQTVRSMLDGDVELLTSIEALRRYVDANPDVEAVVIGGSIDLGAATDLSEAWRVRRPTLGVVLIRRRVDTSVLAEALRAGIREVVDERNLAGVAAAVRRVHEVAAAQRAQAGRSGDDPAAVRGRIVTIFSAKGGCGKTTIATNLAAALADHGRREVCLVDLDLAFGDVAIVLQLFPAHTIADAVPLEATLDASAVRQLLTPHSPGLTALVAPVEPASSTAIPAELVGRILDILRDLYDVVVVDTAPAFDDQVLAAFDRSDVIALLATPDVPALKNLKITLETLALLDYPRDRWRLVLNRSDSKVGLGAGEVEKTLGLPIAAAIPSSRDVPASINRGVPIYLDSPRHPVSTALRTFADTVVAAGPSPVKPTAAIPAGLRTDRRTGLLRRRAKTT